MNAKEIKETSDKIKDLLKKHDTKEDKVSETLFNIYPDEMRSIAKYIITSNRNHYDNGFEDGVKKFESLVKLDDELSGTELNKTI